MFYTNYYWGMNFVWWSVWMVIIFWVFLTPYDIPGQRRRKDSPLDILNKRFASGEISNSEYLEKNGLIERG
ncbi:SHOCT domain-containing protein [Parasediminibacterium sp. JCM 36343]|uniref:SHOCT domain-containing protein n=1 Tax=Parasediminibacterium sp. JCM 36343 TaxID=3374279 RepID=UPI003978A3E5